MVALVTTKYAVASAGILSRGVFGAVDVLVTVVVAVVVAGAPIPRFGLAVGDAVGLCVGLVVGELVGGEVGLAVGAAVHSSPNAPELVCPAGQFSHWPSELPEHDCRVWFAKQPVHVTHTLSLDVFPGARYVPLAHPVTVWLAQDK